GGGSITVDEIPIEIDMADSVSTDSIFSVYVSISGVTDFDAGQFDISFDTAVLQLDSITTGLIGTTQIPVSATNEISPGTYRIVINVPGFPGVSGSGYLAEIRFHVIGSSGQNSNIYLANGFINDNEANEIEGVTWTGGLVTVYEQLVIVTNSLPDGKMGITYSAVVAAQGGTGNYTWSAPLGSLPNGLILNSNTGEISGVPTTIGDISFTIEATDGLFFTSKIISIHVASRPGDANGDSELNTADITTIELIIIGLLNTSEGADANLDSLINTADITKTERLIVGLD
ncbi:cohesin domain-containing protein, partial [Chloroflexota bacterium]